MNRGMNDNTSINTVKKVGTNINWQNKENGQFLRAILSLKDEKEASVFLRDLMTEGEIVEFAKRLEAARLLSQDMQYNYINERTGLSSTTIARISKWLNGSLGGYRLVLNRLANTSNKLSASQHHHNPTKLEKGLSLKHT